ncbi:MAG: hypothetical protein AB8B65_03705 [Kordia sp.]|uniref:hypothetical protein n=1 Tax=Kordia sp. TaxID=1965332 RepID=UPI00385B1808
MSDQNNIDNFFQNRFKDFEASPDPDLWDKISDRLDEKQTEEKKEGIVLLPWLYKAAGIAAAIALLFFVGTQVVNTNSTDIDSDGQTTVTKKDNPLQKDTNGTTKDSQLTNSDKNSEDNSLQYKNNTTPNGTLQNNTQIANEDTVNHTNDPKKSQHGNDSSAQKGNALQNAVAQQNGTQNNSQNDSNKNSIHTNAVPHKNVGNQENAVANATGNEKNKILTPEQRKRLNGQNKKDKNGIDTTVNPFVKNAVAQNQKDGTDNMNTSNTVNGKGSEANSASNAVANKNGVAQNDAQNTTNTSNSTNTKGSEADGTTNSETTDTENAVADTQKEKTGKSILEVIKDLHDLEKDSTEIAEIPFSRWTISPSASPVYYNTLGNGSPIDETFADNSKKGDINLSYGVNVGYDVSKRLTVRAGIHRVDYSYDTQGIALVPSIEGSELTTIQFRNSNAAFDIKDRQATSGEAFSLYQVPTSESSIRQKQIEGDLSQRMSYIEVPVELKYALVDKKIGINVIGGVSTLLLTENSIILDSPELLTELGEATNMNDVSFSTNIGLGIDYKFSNQLEFSVEPMLKYQLNAFSGNTGNFNPYSVGVYTGVSFRF